MAYTAHLLVVARETAESADLLDALRRRAERGPIKVTLLMPALQRGIAGREACRPKLDAAVAAMREAGFEVEGIAGDHDPIEAVVEEWRPGRWDEAIVATLPGATSKWMHVNLPHRVARICDIPVMHVVARPATAEPTLRGGPPPAREPEPLGPLSVLSWGRPLDERE